VTVQHIKDVKELDSSIRPTAKQPVPFNSKDLASDNDTAARQPMHNSPNSHLDTDPLSVQDTTTPTSKLFSLSSFSADQLRSLISSQSSRESEIRVLGTLLRTLVKLGDYQLSASDHVRLVSLLDIICRKPNLSGFKAPIEFKDAVGRKFSFPWQLCKTWKVRCLQSTVH
jgi:hypothetical protein